MFIENHRHRIFVVENLFSIKNKMFTRYKFNCFIIKYLKLSFMVFQ